MDAGNDPVERRDQVVGVVERAVEADPEGDTDAADRLAALDGVVFEDAVDEDDEDDEDDDAAGAPPLTD